jgi:hypothetical protein
MEWLRITPSPYHDHVLIDGLADALVDVWGRLKLTRLDQVSPPNNSGWEAEFARGAAAEASPRDSFRGRSSQPAHVALRAPPVWSLE